MSNPRPPQLRREDETEEQWRERFEALSRVEQSLVLEVNYDTSVKQIALVALTHIASLESQLAEAKLRATRFLSWLREKTSCPSSWTGQECVEDLMRQLASAQRENEELRAERDEARSYILADEERRKLTGDALQAEGEAAALRAKLAAVDRYSLELRARSEAWKESAGRRSEHGFIARTYQIASDELRALLMPGAGEEG